jgi:DNA (cytosine-5)-methyltransferase 1
VTASGAHYAIIDPFLTRFHGGDDSAKRNHSLNEPLPIIDTSNRYGIVEPFITAIGQSSAKDRSRSLDDPLSTVVTKQEHVLITPFILPNEGFYRGNKPRSIDEPLPTATSRGIGALIEPGGEFALDIRFRMLQPHELAAAQGFPGDYKFCGTKTDITKQIGNAVPVNLSRELAETILRTEVA